MTMRLFCSFPSGRKTICLACTLAWGSVKHQIMICTSKQHARGSLHFVSRMVEVSVRQALRPC